MLSKIWIAIKMLGVFLVLFLVLGLLFQGMLTLKCLSEQPGTQVVIGGNSVRCP